MLTSRQSPRDVVSGNLCSPLKLECVGCRIHWARNCRRPFRHSAREALCTLNAPSAGARSLRRPRKAGGVCGPRCGHQKPTKLPARRADTPFRVCVAGGPGRSTAGVGLQDGHRLCCPRCSRRALWPPGSSSQIRRSLALQAKLEMRAAARRSSSPRRSALVLRSCRPRAADILLAIRRASPSRTLSESRAFST